MNFDEILGQALYELEILFGKRNHSKSILPVEFHSSSPQLFYPNERSILVKISESCRSETFRAYYQLGHEAVHILSPTYHGESTVLEEGIAVWFSHSFMHRHTGNYWDSSGDNRYDQAWNLINQLLAESESSLKNIRERFNRFSPLTAENIMEAIPSISRDLASRLAERF